MPQLAEVPSPDVDAARIRAVLLELAQRQPDDEDFENDWSALVGDDPAIGWLAQEDPDAFVDDIFVLVRTTPELFGGVGVDGHLVHHSEPGSGQSNVFVGAVLGSGYYPALVGQVHDQSELFLVREDLNMTDYTVTVLARIGTAARVAIEALAE